MPLCPGVFKSLLWLPPISWPRRHFARLCPSAFLKVEGLRLSPSHLGPSNTPQLQIRLPHVSFNKTDHEKTFQHLRLAKVLHNNTCLASSCFATRDLQPSNSYRSLDGIRLSPVPQGVSATNARTVLDPSK